MNRRFVNYKILVCLILSVAVATGFGFSQAASDLVDRMGYADIVLLDGKIVTMDDRSIVPNTPGNIVQAMAIKGKKIMALGSNVEMQALSGSNTRTIRLDQKTVIPGLIQTHYHLFSSAARTYGPQYGLTDPSIKLNVVADATAEGTARKVRDVVLNAIQVQKIPAGEWISVRVGEGPDNLPGTNRTWFYVGSLNRRQLDAATPDHPVIVTGTIGGYFNEKAIELFKHMFSDWEESTDLETGPGAAMNGYLAVPEQGAVTFEYWWKDKPLSDLAEVMRLQGLDVIRAGVTTVATRLLYPRTVAAFSLLNREGRLPHRLAYYIESQRGNLFNRKSIEQFYRGYGAPWTNHKNGGEMLWLNGMCHEIWDSTQNNICTGPDIAASPDIKNRERCPNPGHKAWISLKTGLVNGWRAAQVHGTSSHGVRLYIQMLEEAMEEANLSVEYVRNLRLTLEHNQVLGNVPDVMEGIKKYGIMLNAQPTLLPEIPKLIDDYGEELRKFAMPVKTWINQGIRVTFEASGIDFWKPIHILVTRKTPVGRVYKESHVILPEEAIDRVTAMKMATTWASEYMMAEDTVGTLEPGKYADFAVLDRDYFTIPVDDILNISNVMTGLSGEIVFDANSTTGAVD
ncbi:MAG: amidohydrolase family protein [Acidobacteriota bacterium]|nr:amidohydrolase family protein [Acidobacteriota bacterium]